VYALATDLVDPEQRGRVRLHGLAKMCRGAFKLSLLFTVLEPLWGAMGISPSVETLTLPWYHPWTLVYNLLLGITAYCLLGTVDVFLGLEQAVAGVRFMDLFEAPILASSPRDFWSRRWNRVVRRQFHGQVFMPKENNKEKENLQPRGGFWGSRNGRGLIVFMLSGVLHELILWSNSREITLENFAFFTLHGIAVMVEANVTRHRPRPSNTLGLWGCRVAFLLFMTLTARLFVAPFLRHDFWTPLPLGFQKVPIPA
jgi:D-alanyl-lipoteichoic acid acyltransferase DltB (MBOAT superfamily)